MIFWRVFFSCCRLTRRAERLYSLMHAALFQKLCEHFSKAVARHWAAWLPPEPSDGTHCVLHSRPRRLAALCWSGLSTTNASSNRWDGNKERKKKKKPSYLFKAALSVHELSETHWRFTTDALCSHWSSPVVHMEFITKGAVYLPQTKIISCSPWYWMLFFFIIILVIFQTKKDKNIIFTILPFKINNKNNNNTFQLYMLTSNSKQNLFNWEKQK